MEDSNKIIDLQAVKSAKLEDMAEMVIKLSKAGSLLAGITMTEYILQKFLQERMRHLSARLEKRVFDGYGPLHTFSAKIDIAYVFKFIDKETYEALKILKDVRNHIAHSPNLFHFEASHLPESFRSLKGFNPKNPLGSFLGLFQQVTRAIASEIEVEA